MQTAPTTHSGNKSGHQNMGHQNMGHGGHSMGDDPTRHAEHNDLQKLIAGVRPTHTAIRSGAWSNPRTWSNGRVPGNNAKVLIKEGTTVTYDQESDVRLHTIANKGTLRFATKQDTKLIVETIINGNEGQLDVGTARQSVAGNKQARIIFTSDRAINRQWDPKQLSKGLISHGTVNIYGADKQDKVALTGDAKAGSDVLKFRELPSGWRVGDRIVLGGTGYDSFRGKDADNSRFQDEVLTITSIKGKEVRFTNENITTGDNTVLRFDHTRSTRAQTDKLKLYAANLTRNVSFETENGKKVPINRRAHVMLMHNPNVNVFNAGFRDLGRTDKRRLIDDVGKNIDGSNGRGTNPRGRYALHLHRTGADDLNGKAALIKGNAIEGSPGWGLVQHDSHAGLEDNVVFDVVGAGIAAESGNEIGWWTDNIVIKTTGIPTAQGEREKSARNKKFDFGSRGDAFWIQGAAQIRNLNNKAVSSNRTGLEIFSGALDNENLPRDAKTIKVKNLPPNVRRLFPADQVEVDIRDVPQAKVSGFESYNANVGIRVWGRGVNFDGELDFSTVSPQTAHEGRSVVENFKVWGNRFSGVRMLYNSNVDLKNGLILGRNEGEFRSGGKGLFDNHANFGGKYDNLTVAGFAQGAEFEYREQDKEFIAPTLQNSNFFENEYNLNKPGDEGAKKGRPDDYISFIRLKNNRFAKVDGNRAPVGKFVTRAVGGLAVELDASGSFDSDPINRGDGRARPLASKGIAAYGWDLNNDGRIDRFGRKLTHIFNRPGSQKVSLTVLDSQGAEKTVQKTVNVRPSAFGNAFDYGDFSGQVAKLEDFQNNSQYSDEGWYVSNGARISGGEAKLSKKGDFNNFVGQVTRNDRVHRGLQKLSFRLKNIEGAPAKQLSQKNEISVTLWGVNGQFANPAWQNTGPEQVGTLPMQRTALVRKNYGGRNGEFFDWKNISLDVNLGKGYDYLMFQVNTARTSNAGDYVAVDNVSLRGNANAVGGRPTGPNPIDPINPTIPAPNPGGTPPNPLPTNPGENPVTRPRFPSNLSPVVRMSFDEGSGKLAVDSSPGGRDNSGRLRGKTKRVDGKFGGAVDFDGRKDFVAIDKSNDLDLRTQGKRTVSMWFNADKAASGQKQVIYEEGSRTRGLNIYLEDNLLHFGGWSTPANRWEGSGIETKKQQVKSGKWHHVALVLDGGNQLRDNAMTAYLDGKLVGKTEGMKLLPHQDGLGIGNVNGTTRYQDGTNGFRGQGLDGSVDEVQIYNNALSAGQVQQLANGFM